MAGKNSKGQIWEFHLRKVEELSFFFVSWVTNNFGVVESKLFVILLDKDKMFSSRFRSCCSKLVSQGEIINFLCHFVEHDLRLM